jgi:hypothetical protein
MTHLEVGEHALEQLRAELRCRADPKAQGLIVDKVREAQRLHVALFGASEFPEHIVPFLGQVPRLSLHGHIRTHPVNTFDAVGCQRSLPVHPRSLEQGEERPARPATAADATRTHQGRRSWRAEAHVPLVLLRPPWAAPLGRPGVGCAMKKAPSFQRGSQSSNRNSSRRAGGAHARQP